MRYKTGDLVIDRAGIFTIGTIIEYRDEENIFVEWRNHNERQWKNVDQIRPVGAVERHEDCIINLIHEDWEGRGYFCDTHHQWVYEFPISYESRYQDGTVMRKGEVHRYKVKYGDLSLKGKKRT